MALWLSARFGLGALSVYLLSGAVATLAALGLNVLVGWIAYLGLPVAQYPEIAPPVVTVSATYPGASAETIQNSVTQIVEHIEERLGDEAERTSALLGREIRWSAR